MTIKINSQNFWLLALLALGIFSLAIMVFDSWSGDRQVDRIEEYNSCITRQIEAGSPTWADTVAACEFKRP